MNNDEIASMAERQVLRLLGDATVFASRAYQLAQVNEAIAAHYRHVATGVRAEWEPPFERGYLALAAALTPEVMERNPLDYRS